MIQEIRKAVEFITEYLLRRQSYDEKVCEKFKQTLYDAFIERFAKHWHPENPNKGSAFRCVRINHDMDPFLVTVLKKINLNLDRLRSSLPYEITVWIDPSEVAYRIGEDGSIGVLFSGKDVKQLNCKREVSPVQRLNLMQAPVYVS